MTIYRFKLTDAVVEEVTAFAKLHRFDDKEDYKESWKNWCNENAEIVDAEKTRLRDIGYTGNVVSKMYKAGRYYFRTKNLDEDKEAKKRRQYIGMEPDIIDAMDTHIRVASRNEEYTPAMGYDEFCKNNITILRDEVIRMTKAYPEANAMLVSNKFKKTYKNRYYLYSKTTQ